MNRSLLLAPCLLLFGVLVFSGQSSEACAPAPPRDVTVEIASESALIIWDEKSKTEHFIRRGAFVAKSTAPDAKPVSDFGFLVPTPTQPTLAEADDTLFTKLEQITAPKTETRQRSSGGGGCGCGMGAMAPGSKSTDTATVEVLEAKHVAGYEASVLKANDSNALTKWLTDHGYQTRPALTEWLKPLIAKGWIVTAFKIARSKDTAKDDPIGSTAVRMSFQTEKPFYPYREPADMHDAKSKRLLRVFTLASQRLEGKLGEQGRWDGVSTPWANLLSGDDLAKVTALAGIKDPLPAEITWLTEFEDRSSPRKGTDEIFFSPEMSQVPVERPARVIYVAAARLPDAFPAYAAMTLGLGVFLWFRRRAG